MRALVSRCHTLTSWGLTDVDGVMAPDCRAAVAAVRRVTAADHRAREVSRKVGELRL